MNDETEVLRRRTDVAAWRLRLAEWVESPPVQRVVVVVILLNAVVLGLETDPAVRDAAGGLLVALDTACLAVFVVELAARLIAYGRSFWSSGWRVFDLLVVGVALVPGSGPFAVLRALRVLRVLRLLTVVPSLRRVVAAFLHAIPGLLGVMALLGVLFYTSAVLSTKLFGEDFPQWFGSIGASLFTLFQVMTLESWSMGIARPVLEVHPWAWAFFVPFIVATAFTALNLFIGIIVSTMQELAVKDADDAAGAAGRDGARSPGTTGASPAPLGAPDLPAAGGTSSADDGATSTLELVARLEADLAALRARLDDPDAEPARV
jgi:voltage-gated sodium channel